MICFKYPQILSNYILTFNKSDQISKNDIYTQVTLLQSGGHLYHGQQSLRYVGRLQDHGTNLTCTVVQLDHLGTVLYSSTISLQLEVSELVIYSQGSGVLEERIGIISGIILAVIFIILIFILLSILSVIEEAGTVANQVEATLMIRLKLAIHLATAL